MVESYPLDSSIANEISPADASSAQAGLEARSVLWALWRQGRPHGAKGIKRVRVSGTQHM